MTPPDARNALAEIVAGIEPAAWMHPSAGWTNKSFDAVRVHCRDDGPMPEPLYSAAQVAARIAALEAQVEGMRVALEPFAKVEPMDVYESEDEDARGVYVLTQGDFRRARAALQSSETTGEK